MSSHRVGELELRGITFIYLTCCRSLFLSSKKKMEELYRKNRRKELQLCLMRNKMEWELAQEVRVRPSPAFWGQMGFHMSLTFRKKTIFQSFFNLGQNFSWASKKRSSVKISLTKSWILLPLKERRTNKKINGNVQICKA